jgi:hypothetical protein
MHPSLDAKRSASVLAVFNYLILNFDLLTRRDRLAVVRATPAFKARTSKHATSKPTALSEPFNFHLMLSVSIRVEDRFAIAESDVRTVRKCESNQMKALDQANDGTAKDIHRKKPQFRRVAASGSRFRTPELKPNGVATAIGADNREIGSITDGYPKSFCEEAMARGVTQSFGVLVDCDVEDPRRSSWKSRSYHMLYSVSGRPW